MAESKKANLDEVDCPKHGRCRVICTSWRMQWYRCMACFEEEESRKVPAIFD